MPRPPLQHPSTITIPSIVVSLVLCCLPGTLPANPVDVRPGKTLAVNENATSDSNSMVLPKPVLNICEDIITHQERVRVKPVALPPYLKRYKEPGFSTTVIRVTDSLPGEVIRPPGNPVQAWNSDESYLMLQQRKNNGELRKLVLDGTSYEVIGDLLLPDHEGEDVFWSHSDPALVFYVTNSGEEPGKLIEHNVETNTIKTLIDFAPHCQANGFSTGSGKLAKPAHNDAQFGYRCEVGNQRSLAISFNKLNGQIHLKKIGRGSGLSEHALPVPTPDGEHYLLDDSVFDPTLTVKKLSLDIASFSEASTLGLNTQGNVKFYQSAAEASPNGCNGDIWRGIGLLVEHDIPEGECRTRITQTDRYPNTPDGTEIFAGAHHQPGWLAMASMGYEDLMWFTSRRVAPLLFSEVYLVNTEVNTPAQVCRLAHHRHYGKYANNADYPLALAKTYVTQSPKGTRVLFSSDWYDSGSINTFVIETSKFAHLDLNGFWQDIDNHTMKTRFVQNGNRLSFRRTSEGEEATINFITTGLGEIKGSRIYLQYVAHVSEVRKVSGTCYSHVKNIHDPLLFECSDTYFGKQRFTLIKPNND